MTGRRLRLGMVGGGIGSMIGDMHRLTSAQAGFDLVAGALSSTKERAAESAARAGIAPDRSYADFAEMAEKEAAREDGVEAVAILTPNHLHVAAARAFMEKGVHIVCEKPMAGALAEAEEAARLAEERNLAFVVTHSYTAMPMVRRAREIVRAGALGDIRAVRSTYLQGWMNALEQAGATPQSNWHFDPARSGIAGTLADVGSHAFQIGTCLTGLEVEEVAADLSAFGSFSALDNDGSVLIRYRGGAKGSVICSQLVAGQENGFSFIVYGTKGSLEWSVGRPEELRFSPVGEATQVLSPGETEAAAIAEWTPLGMKGYESYFAAFTRLYRDAAELIRAKQDGRAPAAFARLAPTAADGLNVMRFVDAAVRSSAANAAWTKL